MLSRTAQYALRSLVYLAQSDRSVPAGEIAEAIGAPANYLAKTLNGLTHHGFVSGRRGPRGGYRLAMRPEAIPLARVVEAFDDTVLGNTCLLGGRTCNSAAPCAAHARLGAVWTEAQEKLRVLTIADLTSDAAIPVGV